MIGREQGVGGAVGGSSGRAVWRDSGAGSVEGAPSRGFVSEGVDSAGVLLQTAGVFGGVKVI